MTREVKLLLEMKDVALMTHYQQQALHNAKMIHTFKENPQFMKTYNAELKKLTKKTLDKTELYKLIDYIRTETKHLTDYERSEENSLKTDIMVSQAARPAPTRPRSTRRDRVASASGPARARGPRPRHRRPRTRA